jgi:hypothetical protein
MFLEPTLCSLINIFTEERSRRQALNRPEIMDELTILPYSFTQTRVGFFH